MRREQLSSGTLDWVSSVLGAASSEREALAERERATTMMGLISGRDEG
jgi:hypothetical protein